MTVFLQHRQTRHFLQRDGTWAPNRDLGRKFPNTLTALETAVRLDLKDVEIVIGFAEREYEVRLPVRAQQPSGQKVGER